MQTGLESSVRKWVLVAVVAVACSRGMSAGSSLTGAPTARDAATLFMAAVKAKDLMAMSTVWGSDRGPARDDMERSELDKRLILLQQCYDHERFQILDDAAGADESRLIRIQVTRGNVTKIPQFKVVRGPSNRWYVLDTDYPAVQGDFCVPSE
jgi:hypothetical protein